MDTALHFQSPAELNLPLLEGCSIVGVFWGDFLEREREQGESDLAALSDLYRTKKIAPLVSARYDLDHAGQAIEALMQRRVLGKVW